MTPLERILQKLPAAKRSGSGWSAKCPAHDDQHPSLTISEGDNGGVVLFCHAGCTVEAIVEALGLRLADLMPQGGPRAAPKAKPATVYPTANEAVAALESYLGKRSNLWTYHDAGGEPVGLVVRWDRADGGKNIRPVSRNGRGWVVGAMPEPRPLYCRNELGTTRRVYICEGEPATDAARSIGLVAVTSAGGSKAAHKADWGPLAGREVIILPDADRPGMAYADAVGTILTTLDTPAMVKVVELPGLPDGGDIYDWLEQHDAVEPETLKERIEALADAAEVWKPEPKQKPPKLKRFEAFPTNVLPEPIRGFVVAGAAAIGCDAANLAVPLLTAIAAAIGNSRRLFIKRGWTVPSILWSMIIGESGTHKTPAVKTVMRPIHKRADEAARRHEEESKQYEIELAMYEKYMGEWKRDKKTLEPPPDKPEPPKAERLVISDATVEAVSPILLANPRGVLLARDELAGWIGSFDRYASKGGADAAHWLSMHSGETIIVDRKSGIPKTIRVPNACVSILGGIQPGVLERALGNEHRESGLLARFLLTCPPRKPRRLTTAEIDHATTAAVAEVFDILYGLQPEPDEDGNLKAAMVTLSGEAWNLFHDFVRVNGDELMDLQGDMAAAWSKLEEIPARLALVIHYVRLAAGDYGADGPDVVDAETMRAAIRLTEWFKSETRRVYGLLGETEENGAARRLTEWVESKGGTVTVRETQQGRKYKTANDAEMALNELVAAGAGAWEIDNHDGGRGRPVARFVLSDSKAVYASTEYTNSEKPEEKGNCVCVDGIDTSENTVSDPDGWGEV